MKLGFVIGAAAALMLSGVAQVRAAHTPPVPSPSPSPAYGGSSAPPSAGSGPQTLSLVDAENIALAQSPLLAIARAQLDSAGATRETAQSGALPNIGVSASSTRIKSIGSSGTGGTPRGQLTSDSANVNLSQLIFDGGRVWSGVRSARYGEDAARYSLARTVQSLFFTIAQDYYAALQARHALIAAQDSFNLARVQEQLVDAQFKAGLAANADVLTARFPMAQAQLKLAQQKFGEQVAIAALLNAMGLPATQSVQLVDDNSTAGEVPANVDQVLAVASVSRPDLLAAQASFKSADLAVRAASLARFPLITATASDGSSGTVPSSGRNGNSYSYGVGLTFPLYDGGAIHAQTSQAQAQARIASANLKTAELGVSLSVQQAFLNFETALASVTAANAELANARTVLDVTNAQYKSGVTTLPLLLNAQVGLTTAKTDQITALYSFKVAQQALLLAEGTIGKP